MLQKQMWENVCLETNADRSGENKGEGERGGGGQEKEVGTSCFVCFLNRHIL